MGYKQRLKFFLTIQWIMQKIIQIITMNSSFLRHNSETKVSYSEVPNRQADRNKQVHLTFFWKKFINEQGFFSKI